MDNRLKLWLLAPVILAHLGLLAWMSRPEQSHLQTPATTAIALLNMGSDSNGSARKTDAKDSPPPLADIQPKPPQQQLQAHSTTSPDSALAGLLYAAPPEEVPASPVIDWVITRGALPPNQMLTLRFTVWVNKDGEIDRFEIDPAQRTVPWANQALSSLLLTAMQPATRDGVPIPSTMMVELQIDTSPNLQ